MVRERVRHPGIGRIHRALARTMTLLLPAGALDARTTVAAGPLAGLAGSLAADLDVVIARGVAPPPGKARLTRRGGRCAHDGELLAFDPYSPRRHRCPRCGREYEGDAHYDWWVMGYQLWLAERVVHAATLQAVHDRDGADRYARFARDTLQAIGALYEGYPNRDNVLGPSRPFFSTYLESIWLLQLAVAVDLLDGRGAGGAVTAAFRDLVIEPSRALIASYDEGTSNRQVWNVAALSAADLVLGKDPGGRMRSFISRLDRSLLVDGTWYEGENYHLFAHRGLWYLVALAEGAGIALPAEFLRRFAEGFVTPFLTALPDLTFPSRRDSQYAVSLRQWRTAEQCELGIARSPGDRRLLSVLERLYTPDIPRGDTGRARSTAEAERNAAPVALDRSDLGWRSLLCALPELPALRPLAPGSVLLEGQGIGILRRDAGRVHVALDYGETGGGHGHPDRLDVLFAHEAARWLDDPGTGSYTDPSLHWYRSTLAHNAPLFDGRSQRRVAGSLSAYEDRGGSGWIEANASGLEPGVEVRRTLVVMTDYLLDVLEWSSDHAVTCELPVHVDGTVTGTGVWHRDEAVGSAAAEDGFAFLRDREAASGGAHVRLTAQRGDATVDARFASEPEADWWRAEAPGVPGTSPRRFFVRRQRGTAGALVALWSWGGSAHSMEMRDGVYRVDLANGERHTHARSAHGWHVDLEFGGARSSIDLGGVRSSTQWGGGVETDSASGLPVVAAAASAPASDVGEPRDLRPAGTPPHLLPRVASAMRDPFLAFDADLGDAAFVLHLGESHYRRSELDWNAAGRPAATIRCAASGDVLLVDVEIEKPDVFFAPAREENPLDNEHPDINSDGLQLYLVADRSGTPSSFAWLVVPVPGAGEARVAPLVAGPEPLQPAVRWRQTVRGWQARIALPVADAGIRPGATLAFDCIVNEMSADRERRRGQLVPAGAGGEFVYLQGDRQSPDRHLQFAWPHA
ncbi:MAG TPA: heparinase II/III family protein [Gemmatimonadaceae bacterium]|nr:heparinase II/III family protein [Gemmatimonadaceae bacterium]